MDPEVKQLFEENLRLSKENNALLVKIRSYQVWTRIYTIAYWFIIIGIAFGAFYFLKPVLGGLTNFYSVGLEDSNGNAVKGNNDVQSLNELIKILKK